ncbi:M23 family metallopeptidase [Hyphomonas sp.]|uniref:M23 family metallopeptidase n=1 Tax=Hyphomonas sp. TaxID=87 RepID=UPI00391A4AB4
MHRLLAKLKGRFSGPAAAAVQRIGGLSPLAERAAAVAILTGLVLLFAFVRAYPATPAPTPLTALADNRDVTGGNPAIARTATLTASVSAADVFEILGAAPHDAAAAATALREAAPTRGERLRAGTPLTAWFEPGPGGADRLTGVSARVSPTSTLMASRRADGRFQASVLTARTETVLQRLTGEIDTSLTEAVLAAGGSRAQAEMLAALYPEDPELARGGRPGERFDIVVEMIADERGNILEPGDLVFAAFNGEVTAGSWYRFTPADTGLPEFYDRHGAAGDEFLSRDPVRGAPITSGFGNRIHPITGDYVLHAGIDFRAPIGTPVRAAGSGLVTDMRWGEGYGWFIRIRHERGYETVYAHLSGFAPKLTPGRTVMRGDLIGYVGDSGSTTGAHLHYEVLRNGFYVNPASLALPSGRDLSRDAEILKAFAEQRDMIDTLRGADIPAYAEAEPEETLTRAPTRAERRETAVRLASTRAAPSGGR